MADDTDDDLELEEWMTLTDAQQEAMLQRELAKLHAHYDKMTPLEYYRARRRSMLQTVMGWRKLGRHPMLGGLDVYRDQLRKMQIQLTKLRMFRATGTWPGSA